MANPKLRFLKENDGRSGEVTYYVQLPTTAVKCLPPSRAYTVFPAATVSSYHLSTTADIETDRRPASQQSNIPLRRRPSASTIHVSSPGSVCEKEVRRQSLISLRQSQAASILHNQQCTTKDGTPSTPEVQPTLVRSTRKAHKKL
ncbi:hypothetical protein PoB_006178000 [Plakobranchus ocellatus]|uniref:Uncharacterized protein n=1 Tax=Plakobranchus ocellatus TaxID=259542 RepID=A0AAV4CTV0_9GAST|nr:hypothetical protein PoB_006178000 [Plakobranchus ocellatus]